VPNQQSQWIRKFGLTYPLIVAPMAGGPSSPELVIATCGAGAMGSIGAAYSKPSEIEEFTARVRAKTSAPIAINLFIPQDPPVVTERELLTAVTKTKKFRAELNLPTPELHPPYHENFDRQFEAVMKLQPALFSFIFGVLKPEYVSEAKKRKIALVGTATTLDEAISLQESGVDAIVLQGYEAGGHRGIFDSRAQDREMRLFDLLSVCRPQIRIPLIAAGGLMEATRVRQALAAGAEAVQLGTAFLCCQEAGTSAPYRSALMKTNDRFTRTTRAFSGRLARGIENRFMREMDLIPEGVLPFPVQNKFTGDIRREGAKQGRSDFLSLWAGQGRGAMWTGSAKGLIETLFDPAIVSSNY
jgi:nitronate monooxygenase